LIALWWLALPGCGSSTDEAAQLRIYCEAVNAHPRVEGADQADEQERIMAVVSEVRTRFAEAGISDSDNVMTRMSTMDPAARGRVVRELAAKGGLEDVCQAALAEL
jgi:hypothetical protein